MGSRIRDLAGERFGRLRVVSPASTRISSRVAWNCLCDCGVELQVAAYLLLRGSTQSCGCLVIDMLRSRTTTHGLTDSPTYSSWSSMLSRCNNPSSSSYPRYGETGVTVCSEWLTFEKFLEDMGIRPENTSLDRIDGSRGYYPGNCRWASTETQNRNRCTTVILTVRGIILSVPEWVDIGGVPSGVIRRRIRCGFDPVVCVFYPTQSVPRLSQYRAEEALTLSSLLFEDWKLSNPNIDKCIAVVRATWENR